MARRTNHSISDQGTTRQIVSTAADAAQTLSVGVLHLAQTTALEAWRAIASIGSELASAGRRVARGSIKAAEDIGGDLAMVGNGVSRGVREPAREVGSNIVRLARGLWTDGVARGRRPGTRAGKMPAKSPRRRRRSSAACPIVVRVRRAAAAARRAPVPTPTDRRQRRRGPLGRRGMFTPPSHGGNRTDRRSGQ